MQPNKKKPMCCRTLDFSFFSDRLLLFIVSFDLNNESSATSVDVRRNEMKDLYAIRRISQYGRKIIDSTYEVSTTENSLLSFQRYARSFSLEMTTFLRKFETYEIPFIS